MRILHLTLEELHSKLHVIGFAAENLHTRMVIDCTRIFIEYPGAVASMAVQPPTGDTYPATISTNGANVIWDITNSDLKYPGEGRVQLTFMLEDVAVKTYIGKVVIMKSLMATGSVPDPLEDFIAKAEKMLQDLEKAKESGEFDGPPGPQGPEGPAGADGKDGAPGRDGKDGADGAPGRDGADGKDGADGAPGADGVTYTPSVSSEGVISWTNDGNRQNPSPVNIKGPAGPAGADGQQGPAGQDGQDATPDLIAAAYEDLTYPVSAGTLCYNGEVLYRAKQDIPTSESWTAEHWDATTVAAEMSRLNGAINVCDDAIEQITELLDTEAIESTNLWNKNAAQVGYLHKNGNVYTGGSYDNFVYGSVGEVNQGNVLNFYRNNNGSIVNCTVQFVVCYDSNGAVMSDAGTSSVTSFTVPQNVKSIKITILNAENADFMALKNNASAPSAYIPYSEPRTCYVASADFIHEAYEQEAQAINGKVDAIYTADAEDQGKVLQAKTVANGKVTEWDYVSAGGSPSGDYVTTDLMQKCELKEFPKSVNLWDNDHKHPGWFHQNGNIYDYAGYYYWNIGTVSEGDVIYCYYESSGIVYQGTMYAVVCLDSNEATMPSVSATSVTSFTVPAGVSTITVTINNPSEKTMIVKNIDRPAEFIPYYEAYSCYVATPEFIHDALTSDIVLNVPAKVYAVVGIEMNIYFENVTEDWTKYHWDVTCTKGRQMKRGYTITPVVGDIGEYTLTIRASIDENAYEEVSTTLVVAAASSASGVSIIVLGDSTTDSGTAVAKIHTDFESDSTTVQTLGTRGTSPNNHEGRSGWKASDYLTVQTRDGVSNPFYNPSTTTFDASYYFMNSGVSVPDWFFINLGVNDVFGYVSDTELNVWIPRILGYYDTMVESLQTADSSMKIGICITIPPNNSQDAFGKDYNCGQTRDRCKRNNAIWASKLIEHFAGKENERVYLVPIHVNLDTVYNMGMETFSVNARNTAITYESPTANGGVHPVESGYWQIADVYTAFLKGNAT